MQQLGSKTGPKVYCTYDDKDKSFSYDGVLGTRIDTVTQATSITTGVTLNSPGGIITTQSTTQAAAAAAPETFVLTNSELGNANRTLIVTLHDYTGAGSPGVYVTGRDTTASTASITVINHHASNALDDALQIRFWVIGKAFADPL